MFGFRLTYLRGSVTAADVRRGNSKDEIEWPPHPDRLFCALAQAWGDLGRPDGAGNVLRWLETLPPPLVRASGILSRCTVQRYVPVNDVANPFERTRRPRLIPSATLSDDCSEIWWPDVTLNPEQRFQLRSLAAAVASIGHSSSLVATEVIESSDGLVPTSAPRLDGEEILRVPSPGRFEELVAAYDALPRRRPPMGAWASYGRPRSEDRIARGFHEDLLIFRMEDESPPLPLEASVSVIGVWRRALLSKADQPPSEAITGHAPESTPDRPGPSSRPHLALIPLADLGHAHARSHLLGLAAALPSGFSDDERRACLRALGRVERLNLGRLGTWLLKRCDASESRRALLGGTWCRPSKVWATVTPAVFGRYPRDLFGDEAVSMMREACLIAGLPEPVEVRIAPVSWIAGVPPARNFPPAPSRPGKPRRAHAHVRLEFASLVQGPVLLGAGRHQGYGLLRQVTEPFE